jgi:hypothetical protein
MGAKTSSLNNEFNRTSTIGMSSRRCITRGQSDGGSKSYRLSSTGKLSRRFFLKHFRAEFYERCRTESITEHAWQIPGLESIRQHFKCLGANVKDPAEAFARDMKELYNKARGIFYVIWADVI